MSDKKLLTESWVKAFGEWNKTLLKYIYGKDVKLTADVEVHKSKFFEGEEDENKLNFVIRGEQKDVKAYADAIMAMKAFLDAYTQYGDDHMQTRKAREILRQRVRKFESETGITWPFDYED